MAFKVNFYTTVVESDSMVTGYEILDASNAKTGTLSLALSSVPDDFFSNYFDYKIETGALVKLSTPLNNTLNKPNTNTNYTLAFARNTTGRLFDCL